MIENPRQCPVAPLPFILPALFGIEPLALLGPTDSRLSISFRLLGPPQPRLALPDTRPAFMPARRFPPPWSVQDKKLA
jgi:hypothetical protein